MWDFERRRQVVSARAFMEDEVTVKNEVEIDGAGGPTRCFAGASELPFNVEEMREQFARREICSDFHHGVEIARLIGRTNGRTVIDA